MKDYLETTKSFSPAEERKYKKQKRYQKLTQLVKKELVEMIVRQNFSIRKASKYLNINYSSAKIILNKYRQKQRTSYEQEGQLEKSADVREIEFKITKTAPILLVSLVGGRYQSQNSQIKKLIQPCFF